MSFDLSTTTNLMNNSLLTLHRNSSIDINRIWWIHYWIWFHIISMFYRINSHSIIQFIAHPNDSHQVRKYLYWKHICQHYHLSIDLQYEWYYITNSYSIHEIIYILLFHQSNSSTYRKLIYSINIHSIQFFFNQSFIPIHMSFIGCPFTLIPISHLNMKFKNQ